MKVEERPAGEKQTGRRKGGQGHREKDRRDRRGETEKKTEAGVGNRKKGQSSI